MLSHPKPGTDVVIHYAKDKAPPMTIDAALEIVRHSIPSIDTYPRMKRLAEIKRLLKRLDGRSICWKESDE